MTKVERKQIKILSSGSIRAKGWVCGPILKPYYESTSTIFGMLRDNVKVVEVLPNGEEIKLTAANFDRVNLPTQKEEAPIADTVVEADVPVTLQPKVAPLSVTENVTHVEETIIITNEVVEAPVQKPSPLKHQNKKNKK